MGRVSHPNVPFPWFTISHFFHFSLYIYEISSFFRMKNRTCKKKPAHLMCLHYQAQLVLENLSSAKRQQPHRILHFANTTLNNKNSSLMNLYILL